MHRDLVCGGFQAPYLKLNATTSIGASWPTIAKNIMCLEAEHMQPIESEWWLCLAIGFGTALQAFQFDLRPRAAFVTKPKTRLASASYLAGEAFTRAFAQDELLASIVLQLDLAPWLTVSHESTLSKNKPGAPQNRPEVSVGPDGIRLDVAVARFA